MQPGTAGLTLTSDTDIDSLGSLVLALYTQNSASEMRCGSTFILSVISSKQLLLDAAHCQNMWSLLFIYTMYSTFQLPMKAWLSALLCSLIPTVSSLL